MGREKLSFTVKEVREMAKWFGRWGKDDERGTVNFLSLEKAADCAAQRVYEFFFVAPPLPVTGAVGSPIDPQAIK